MATKKPGGPTCRSPPHRLPRSFGRQAQSIPKKVLQRLAYPPWAPKVSRLMRQAVFAERAPRFGIEWRPFTAETLTFGELTRGSMRNRGAPRCHGFDHHAPMWRSSCKLVISYCSSRAGLTRPDLAERLCSAKSTASERCLPEHRVAIDRGMRKEEVGEHHGGRAEHKIVELPVKIKAALVGRSFCAAGGFQVGSVFSDPVVATAILDRLLHHSHVITIRGDSHLSKEKRRSGLLQKPAALSEKQL